MISKLANDINSSLLEGYDPFTFSEGLDQRKSTQIRFEHLEFCVRIMDTDTPSQVIRPAVPWNDPYIRLDPAEMMTFPMTFSPYINSTIGYLVEKRRLEQVEFDQKDNEKLEVVPVANLNPPTLPCSLPPPQAPGIKESSNVSKEEVWSTKNIQLLIELSLQRSPTKLIWSTIKYRLQSCNPENFHQFITNLAVEMIWISLLSRSNDSKWGDFIKEGMIKEVERMIGLGEVKQAEEVRIEYGMILFSRGIGTTTRKRLRAKMGK